MPAYRSDGSPRRVKTPSTPTNLEAATISPTQSYSEVDPQPCSSISVGASLPTTHMDVEEGWENVLPRKVGNFELLAEEKLDYADVTIAKWRSNQTGLKVVWADVEGPLVQGYFSVVTEIFDDSGRPHTLEHLIFMGSEQYPYKGVLDTLANRLFANGTNAWTDTSNTTYTVGTAGEEGFLGILPVFLDHVLYPTMKQEAFVTEVHHVNGKGEDSGVVYSEMQGRENDSGDLMMLRRQRTLYNKKNALRSETGGLMSALRTLKVEEIREYHASSYVPQNLTLIVTGRSLSPDKLLTTLQKTVEPSIAAHQQAHGPQGPPGWKRPFVESNTATNPPRIPESVTELVLFPEQDESMGEVTLSWIGVGWESFLDDVALEVLGEYLTQSAVSPLYKKFVEVEQPACTDITFDASIENPSILTVYLSSVPTKLLATLPEEFKSALASIAMEGIDMERMASIIERQRLQLLEALETDATQVLSNTILADAIFGAEDGSDLRPAFADTEYYKQLSAWTSAQWTDLMRKFYIEPKSVTIIGQPSIALADKIELDEKNRVAGTAKKMGPEGLARLAKKVEEAQSDNDKPIPPEIIKNFDVPDVEKIEWIEVETALSGSAKGARESRANRTQAHVDADVADEPVFLQYDRVSEIKSAFIEVSVVMFFKGSEESSSMDYKALLPIYLDSFFTLPVSRANGLKLTFEEVVRQLDAETLSYSIDVNSPLQEGVTLRIKVAKDKYAIAVEWINDLLWGSHYDIDRLKISTTKALQNLPGEKRSGSEVSYAIYRQMINSEESMNLATNLLTRTEFLPVLLKRLNDEPEEVVNEFQAFRAALTNPHSMRVSVKGDILDLNNPSSTWLSSFKKMEKIDFSNLFPVILGRNVLSPLGQATKGKAVVFTVSSIESSFAQHAAKGPDSWIHPDQPALTVARSVLNAMEGYLWKFIRGAGLAYGANIIQDVETGHVIYRVYKSPDSYEAFMAAKTLVDQLVSGKIIIDDITIESAKSSLAYNTAQKESTMNDAANSSFTNTLLGLPADHGRRALAKTKTISREDILRVIQLYIQPIFEPGSSIASIATGTAKASSIAERFEKLGYDVERRSFGDHEDDEDEDEDNEEDEEQEEVGARAT